jgi:uncharacterized protein (DUF488 family)
MELYTIGYGNRAIGDFIDLLRRYGVEVLVDTRSIPYSRFRPDFRKKALQQHLEAAGIGYLYLGDALGGKHVPEDCIVNGKVDLERLSENLEFQTALAQVEAMARAGQSLVLMCAELRPENCHRTWMLAPVLHTRGLSVRHIDERGDLKTQEEVLGWFGP